MKILLEIKPNSSDLLPILKEVFSFENIHFI